MMGVLSNLTYEAPPIPARPYVRIRLITPMWTASTRRVFDEPPCSAYFTREFPGSSKTSIRS